MTLSMKRGWFRWSGQVQARSRDGGLPETHLHVFKVGQLAGDGVHQLPLWKQVFDLGRVVELWFAGVNQLCLKRLVVDEQSDRQGREELPTSIPRMNAESVKLYPGCSEQE